LSYAPSEVFWLEQGADCAPKKIIAFRQLPQKQFHASLNRGRSCRPGGRR